MYIIYISPLLFCGDNFDLKQDFLPVNLNHVLFQIYRDLFKIPNYETCNYYKNNIIVLLLNYYFGLFRDNNEN